MCIRVYILYSSVLCIIRTGQISEKTELKNGEPIIGFACSIYFASAPGCLQMCIYVATSFVFFVFVFYVGKVLVWCCVCLFFILLFCVSIIDLSRAFCCLKNKQKMCLLSIRYHGLMLANDYGDFYR